jgi:hypothetical protein
MNGCLESQFELQKLKILKGASGVNVDFAVSGNDSVPTVVHHVENPTFAHPDLLNAVNAIKELLVKAIGKESIHTERVIAGLKSNFKKETTYLELEKLFEDHYIAELQKVTVTGVAISGYDQNRGAIITGTYLCKNGSKIALNSPRVRFEGELFGWEKVLDEACQVIAHEAYEYTFKDKQAQQTIDFGTDGTEPEKPE